MGVVVAVVFAAAFGPFVSYGQVESIVLSFISMLSSPNDESPSNIEAAVSISSSEVVIEMAMRKVAESAIRTLGSRSCQSRQLHATPGSKKIVGVFYKAREHAEKNPNFVGCVERGLGIRSTLCGFM
ncbi:formate dehydrogenase, mitochondrial-like isoform X2 [Dioscorea cayenensis subsp. rotundata]|nr:formate dehydrogenase, mitochondrial-like isoform X2 [Dioscorea cayenensis subsp. rotundata]XP_039142434.1 formate dehydrogenase, mitochondrial-like isoform X2 [Dioscorea cayenensis subsp. rotundata]XP_039142435.1 formate dehydrogenase, mitochondrial-like isoform X2 [Dioscorea cayenensis subsp. rotundata]